MNINDLTKIVKKKIDASLSVENIDIEDKTFLHKNHKSHDLKKFHIKLIIKSSELKGMKKIDSTRKIYSILHEELNQYIHSIQILIR
ncbi:MAG: BolA family transcriptional regulator [Pelagibacteraceae bacterium TMED268]|nr:MAG: BolA family transcriptional regulator [Pelagibacteraceae bacterium TMED268]|tara:strand:+ start:7629 stop:7889 length:261 start_codon:yes stop_codon:yes gene_type:complete